KFINGQFDINFLEKDFQFSTSNNDENLTDAASIFTSYLKYRNSNSNDKDTQSNSTANKWTKQLYE
ncbi:MAG TPA: hypothetical protein VLB50_02090, partial [Ignavibacteriaceae bacterium]|nr:hypothetical protein [Ignavibacteriaceae bacterium]